MPTHAVRSLLLAATLLAAAALARAELPRTMAWSAYNLGTTGYNQAVGIGQMLRQRHGVTLRVIPGKNDVSRLLPLRRGLVQFSANGVATWFAQEGLHQFADDAWGPLPLRLVAMASATRRGSIVDKARNPGGFGAPPPGACSPRLARPVAGSCLRRVCVAEPPRRGQDRPGPRGPCRGVPHGCRASAGAPAPSPG